jgi:hypothetical protein
LLSGRSTRQGRGTPIVVALICGKVGVGAGSMQELATSRKHEQATPCHTLAPKRREQIDSWAAALESELMLMKNRALAASQSMQCRVRAQCDDSVGRCCQQQPQHPPSALRHGCSSQVSCAPHSLLSTCLTTLTAPTLHMQGADITLLFL